MNNFFFLLLVIFLPTQLGIHFWPDFAFINGIRVDYFSPTIYFTDILIVGIIVFETIQFFRKSKLHQLAHKWHESRIKFYLFAFVSFCLLAYLNINSSLSPAVSTYKWIKFLEFGLLGLIVIKRFKTYPLKPKISSLMLVPVFYESLLAIWQFFSQSSVGGLWYLLGERTFNSSTPGIANAYFNGQLLMRPYGTFPHPNVLGAFFAVFLPIILARFLHNSRNINAGNKLKVIVCWLIVIILGYCALFLSLSRAAIFVGVVASFVVALPYLKNIWKIWPIGLIGLVAMMYLFWPRISSLGLETEPIVVREQLNQLAIEKFAQFPFIGSGLGTSPLYNQNQSLSTAPRIKNFALQFQPTHNVYLLILAETGVLGLGILIIVGALGIARTFRLRKSILFFSLLSFAVLGLFDHYILTLQQGQVLLTLFLGFSFATPILLE